MKMEIIKKYKGVILIVAIILVLVLFRSINGNHFQSDAKKWAEPSAERSNIITLAKMNSMSGKILIIRLDSSINPAYKVTGNILYIRPESILLKKNLKAIRNFSGSVLINSEKPDVSARIWMLLSQMGVRNLYILASDTDNEAFKNEFRPDTLVRPEL